MIAALGAAPASQAAVMEAVAVHVTTFFTYPNALNGDVAVNVDAVSTGCEGGFWMSKSDPGYTATYAAVLMAYATKSPVNVWFDTSLLWAGSSAHTCKIYAFNPV